MGASCLKCRIGLPGTDSQETIQTTETHQACQKCDRTDNRKPDANWVVGIDIQTQIKQDCGNDEANDSVYGTYVTNHEVTSNSVR